MNAIADDVLAHYGIVVDESVLEVGGELAQFGVKGMHWGVRKSESGDAPREGWTDNQKRKLKVVGGVAVAAAVVAGAYFGAKALSANGKVSVKTASNAAKKVSDGAKVAEAALKARGNVKVGTLDPELRKFLKDSPQRILSDQKEWSKFLGQSLHSIQKEDLAFMNEQISFMTKALGK